MADVHTLASGLVFGESPRWRRDRLYCFDIATNEVLQIDSDGKLDVLVREPSGIASIGFLNGDLLVARRTGLIRRRQADGTFVQFADLSDLSDKPWNDMVVDVAAIRILAT